MRYQKRFAGLCVGVVVTLAAQAAYAQSTIFNIPTTDAVERGKVYFEFDFIPQVPAAEGADRVYVYNPRVVVGLGGRVEVGVNVPTFQNVTSCGPGPETCNYIQTNVKWKFYNDDMGGIAIAAGALAHIPLNRRDGQDSWGLVYASGSKKFVNSDYGPRFHAGPYGITSANQDPFEGPVSFTGERAGVLLGYEQPIHSNVSIVAEWLSGKNFFGYFTPGISIILPGNGLLNMGYSIGNDSWENNNATKNRFLFLYYGVTF